MTITVTLGFNPQDGVPITAADLRALGLPNVSLVGSVETGDIENGAITFAKLNPMLILGGDEVSSLEPSDYFLIGDDSAVGNAVIRFGNFLPALLGLAADVTAFDSWTNDRVVYRQADGLQAKAMSPAVLAEQLSLIHI